MWVPPTVPTRLSQETLRREAEAGKAFAYQQTIRWVEDFNRDLERVWTGMRLLWCPDPAPVEAVAMGARPGRWGILMPSTTGGPGSVKPLTGPEGEYVEPGSWVFDQLHEQDWWNPQVMRERERVERKAKEAAERRKQQEREDRDREVLERYLAVSRTQVSMNRDTPWTQNNSAMARRDARGRRRK